MENQANPIQPQYNQPPVDQPPRPQAVQPTSEMQPKKTNWFMIMIIIILCSALFGAVGYYFGQQSNSNDIINAPISVETNQNEAIDETVELEPVISDETETLKTYDSRYITLQYPASMYEWSLGQDIDLDLFEVHSTAKPETGTPETMATISVDVHNVGYTFENTIDEVKEFYEGLDESSGHNPASLVINDREVDGLKGVETSIEGNRNGQGLSLSKQIWVRKNDIIYAFYLNIISENQTDLEQLQTEYVPIFEKVVDSAELKEV